MSFFMIIPLDKRGKEVCFISPHGLQTQALDSLIDQLPHALTPDKITGVYKFYSDFRAIIYAYDIRQPKIIHTMDATERRLCEETLRHLNCFLDTKSQNPLARAWFLEWFHIES